MISGTSSAATPAATPAGPSTTSSPGSPPRPLVVGVALVDAVTAPRALLAARRTAPPALAGLWEFPGGKVEPGESPRAGLLREVREELGVTVRLGAEVLAPEPEGWLLDNGARMRVYLGVLVGEATPQPLADHDRLAWTELGATALHALDWIPADRPIVDALLVRVAQTDLGLEDDGQR